MVMNCSKDERLDKANHSYYYMTFCHWQHCLVFADDFVDHVAMNSWRMLIYVDKGVLYIGEIRLFPTLYNFVPYSLRCICITGAYRLNYQLPFSEARILHQNFIQWQMRLYFTFTYFSQTLSTFFSLCIHDTIRSYAISRIKVKI